jgi:hypothetical protein
MNREKRNKWGKMQEKMIILILVESVEKRVAEQEHDK